MSRGDGPRSALSTGEAGIGKSRLVTEVAAVAAPEGGRPLRGVAPSTAMTECR